MYSRHLTAYICQSSASSLPIFQSKCYNNKSQSNAGYLNIPVTQQAGLAVTLLANIQEKLGSDFGRDIGYTD